MVQDADTVSHLSSHAERLEGVGADLRDRLQAWNGGGRLLAAAAFLRARIQGEAPPGAPPPVVIEDGPRWSVIGAVAAQAAFLRTVARNLRPGAAVKGASATAELASSLQADWAEAATILEEAADVIDKNTNLWRPA